MHRTALALAKTRRARHDLFDHITHITTFGNTMAMATVSTADKVSIQKVITNTGGYRFLAVIAMDKSRDIACLKLFKHTPLKFSNGLHGAVRCQHFFLAHWHSFCGILRRHYLLSPI